MEVLLVGATNDWDSLPSLPNHLVVAPTNNTSTTSHLSLHLDDFLVFKTTVEKVIEVD